MPGTADASYASGSEAIDTSFICMIDGMQIRIARVCLIKDQGGKEKGEVK